MIIKAIEQNGGEARLKRIVEVVQQMNPTVTEQSIKFTLYYGTVGSNPRFKRVKRGTYSV
jgi:hypothetical protein